MVNGCPEYEVYFKTGINKETEFSAHSLWEMLLVVSGRLEMKTFDGSLRTRGAVLALIPPGVHHCHMLLSSGAEYVRYVFYFSPALLTDAAAFVAIQLLLLIPSLFISKIDPSLTVKAE